MKYRAAFDVLRSKGLDPDDTYIALRTAMTFGMAITKDEIKIAFSSYSRPGGVKVENFTIDDPRELVPR